MANFIPRLEWDELEVEAAIEGTTLLTHIADTSDIGAGDSVHGADIPFDTHVVSKTSTTVTIDKAATDGIPERTNLLTYTEYINLSAWIKTAAGLGTTPTVMSDAGEAPDGSCTANRIIMDIGAGTAGTDRSEVRTILDTVIGVTYTFSVYLKSYNGVAQTILIDFGGTGGVLANVTSTWQRFSTTYTTPATTHRQYIRLRGTLGTSLSADILAWGAQTEIGDYVSPYIPSVETFTSRASKGHFVNSTGKLELANTDIQRLGYNPLNLSAPPKLVLENATTNLITYSEDINNAAWTKTNTTIYQNYGTAPDGSYTADAISKTSAFGSANQAATATLAIHTASAFFKAGTGSTVTFRVMENATTVVLSRANINLTTGAVTNIVGTTYSEEWPDGWFRVWSTVTFTNTDARILIYGGVDSDSSALSVLVWGVQLELGTKTSYIPTTPSFTSRASTATYVNSSGLIASAAIDVARNSYNQNDLSVAPKLLLEATSTNRNTYSEDFSHANWVKVRTSIIANDITGPDGTLSGDRITDTTVSGSYAYQAVAVSSGTTYTLSVFAKAGTHSSIIFTDFTEVASSKIFNISTGAISGSSSGAVFNDATTTITAYPNGWYRCSVSFVPTVTSTHNVGIQFQGDTVSNYFYLWGAQFESGFLSSYIPTVASTVARSADISSSASATRAADLSSSVAGYRAPVLRDLIFAKCFDFTYPSTKQVNPTYEALEQISDSISGIRQTQLNGLIKKVDLEFKFLTSAQVTDLEENFYLPWAVMGKDFRYYESKDVDDYEEYALDNLDFKPVRSIPKAGDFLKTLPFKFRKVVAL